MNKRVLTLLLALAVALAAAPAFAEASPGPQDPVLATVGGEPIYKSQVEATIPSVLQNQYITDATDYRTVVQTMAQNKVFWAKVEEMGFSTFSQEELDAFTAEAQTLWNEYVSSYADYYQTEDTEEARLAAIAQVEAELAASGTTVEGVAEQIREKAAQDRMNDYMLAGYEPTAEEIAAIFNLYGQQYRQLYENDIGEYEFKVLYYGEESWYTPEGYRGIVHILLKPDEDLLAEYQALSAAYEEQQGADTEPTQSDGAEASPEAAGPAEQPAPVTAEALEQARQAVLESRRADIDAIYARIEAGEDFIGLIREYGVDPGMGDETNLAQGYAVHAQSILYDPVFTAAAYSDRMQAPGDVSDPAVSSFGIHILKYLRDVPSGLILTDEIAAEIGEFLSMQKLNTEYGTALTAWMEQADVVFNEEAIAQAIAEAQGTAQSPEEIAPEAPPEATAAP